MIEPEHTECGLPALDCSEDPRGGAAAWALIVVGLVLLAALIAVGLWIFGVW